MAQYGPLPAAEAANHTPQAHGGSVIELVSKKPNSLKFLTNGDVVDQWLDPIEYSSRRVPH